MSAGGSTANLCFWWVVTLVQVFKHLTKNGTEANWTEVNDLNTGRY